MQSKRNILFLFCTISAIGLMVGGFFCPPMGVIDGSVLSAAGIIFAFASLAQLPTILNAGNSATIKTPNSEIEIRSNDDN